jgi:hypothetical protein
MRVIRAIGPRRAGRVSAVFLAVGLLAACQTSRQRIVDHENDLAAAGFVVRPADTAERQALLARLPEHKFVQRVNAGKVHYVYADASFCKCLYVGSEAAYGQYQQNKQSKAQVKELERDLKRHNNAAEDDDLNAQVYSDPAYNWEAWGPWDYY